MGKEGRPSREIRLPAKFRDDSFQVEHELHTCICKRPFKKDAFMIACEIKGPGCPQWYHGSCVGLTLEESKKVRRFICSICADLIEGSPTEHSEDENLNDESILPQAKKARKLKTIEDLNSQPNIHFIPVGKRSSRKSTSQNFSPLSPDDSSMSEGSRRNSLSVIQDKVTEFSEAEALKEMNIQKNKNYANNFSDFEYLNTKMQPSDNDKKSNRIENEDEDVDICGDDELEVERNGGINDTEKQQDTPNGKEVNPSSSNQGASNINDNGDANHNETNKEGVLNGDNSNVGVDGGDHGANDVNQPGHLINLQSTSIPNKEMKRKSKLDIQQQEIGNEDFISLDYNEDENDNGNLSANQSPNDNSADEKNQRNLYTNAEIRRKKKYDEVEITEKHNDPSMSFTQTKTNNAKLNENEQEEEQADNKGTQSMNTENRSNNHNGSDNEVKMRELDEIEAIDLLNVPDDNNGGDDMALKEDGLFYVNNDENLLAVSASLNQGVLDESNDLERLDEFKSQFENKETDAPVALFESQNQGQDQYPGKNQNQNLVGNQSSPFIFPAQAVSSSSMKLQQRSKLTVKRRPEIPSSHPNESSVQSHGQMKDNSLGLHKEDNELDTPVERIVEEEEDDVDIEIVEDEDDDENDGENNNLLQINKNDSSLGENDPPHESKGLVQKDPTEFNVQSSVNASSQNPETSQSSLANVQKDEINEESEVMEEELDLEQEEIAFLEAEKLICEDIRYLQSSDSTNANHSSIEPSASEVLPPSPSKNQEGSDTKSHSLHVTKEVTQPQIKKEVDPHPQTESQQIINSSTTAIPNETSKVCLYSGCRNRVSDGSYYCSPNCTKAAEKETLARKKLKDLKPIVQANVPLKRGKKREKDAIDENLFTPVKRSSSFKATMSSSPRDIGSEKLLPGAEKVAKFTGFETSGSPKPISEKPAILAPKPLGLERSSSILSKPPYNLVKPLGVAKPPPIAVKTTPQASNSEITMRKKLVESLAQALELVHGDQKSESTTQPLSEPKGERKKQEEETEPKLEPKVKAEVEPKEEPKAEASSELPSVTEKETENTIKKEATESEDVEKVRLEDEKKKESIVEKKVEGVEIAGGKELSEIKAKAAIVAEEIEKEMYAHFNGAGKKYRERARSLLFNLKDPKNPELRSRVLSGEISASSLCSMTVDDLASKELSKWRSQKAKEHALQVVLTESIDYRRVLKKTHKGEVELDLPVDPTPSLPDDPIVPQSSADITKDEKNSTVSSDHLPLDVTTASTPAANLQKKDDVTSPSKTSGMSAENKDLNRKAEVEKAEEVKTEDQPLMLEESEGAEKKEDIQPEGNADVATGDDEKSKEEGKFSMTNLPSIMSMEEYIASLSKKEGMDEDEEDKKGEQEGDKEKDDGDQVEKVDKETKSEQNEKGKETVEVRNEFMYSSPKFDRRKPSSPKEKKSSTPEKEKPVKSSQQAREKLTSLWFGELVLSRGKAFVKAVFRCGELLSLHDFMPDSVEAKGRVKLTELDKFLFQLHSSASRSVMVVSFISGSENDDSSSQSIKEFLNIAEQYKHNQRVGFAEPSQGVELYLLPVTSSSFRLLQTHRHYLDLEEKWSETKGELLIGIIVRRKTSSQTKHSGSDDVKKKSHLSSSGSHHNKVKQREERKTDTETETQSWNSPSENKLPREKTSTVSTTREKSSSDQLHAEKDKSSSEKSPKPSRPALRSTSRDPRAQRAEKSTLSKASTTENKSSYESLQMDLQLQQEKIQQQKELILQKQQEMLSVQKQQQQQQHQQQQWQSTQFQDPRSSYSRTSQPNYVQSPSQQPSQQPPNSMAQQGYSSQSQMSYSNSTNPQPWQSVTHSQQTGRQQAYSSTEAKPLGIPDSSLQKAQLLSSQENMDLQQLQRFLQQQKIFPPQQQQQPNQAYAQSSSWLGQSGEINPQSGLSSQFMQPQQHSTIPRGLLSQDNQKDNLKDDDLPEFDFSMSSISKPSSTALSSQPSSAYHSMVASVPPSQSAGISLNRSTPSVPDHPPGFEQNQISHIQKSNLQVSQTGLEPVSQKYPLVFSPAEASRAGAGRFQEGSLSRTPFPDRHLNEALPSVRPPTRPDSSFVASALHPNLPAIRGIRDVTAPGAYPRPMQQHSSLPPRAHPTPFLQANHPFPPNLQVRNFGPPMSDPTMVPPFRPPFHQQRPSWRGK